MSLLLKNCKVIEDGNTILRNILISEGKIISIISENSGNSDEINCEKVIDCNNKLVLPGLIDPHVHFREPGMEHKEDFLSGSCAAAAGGITTVLDMPNTNPPTFTLSDLENKKNLAMKSIVNFGFYFGASADDNIMEIKKAFDSGNVAAVKVYMNDTTGNLLITDNLLLEKIFETAKISEKVVAVHAEGEMVKKAVELAKKCGNKLYLCHISTKEEIDYINTNKTNGNDNTLFVEVSPHHLFLTEEDDNGAFTKMKPVLKTINNQQALFDAVNSGVVDVIGTDHAPHTLEEKREINYPYGVPGCETVLPLLLNAVNEGRISLKKVQELCCENPAKIFGIKNKGFIKEGYDADLVILDLEMERIVENEKLFTKCKWSPFAGKKLKGWPIMTIVNGNIVYSYSNSEGHEKIVLNKDYKGKEVIYNVR